MRDSTASTTNMTTAKHRTASIDADEGAYLPIVASLHRRMDGVLMWINLVPRPRLMDNVNSHWVHVHKPSGIFQ